MFPLEVVAELHRETMSDQPETLQAISAGLDAAAKELRTVFDGIAQVQAALQQLQECDDVQRMNELELLWQHLNDLGRPMINVGANVISAMHEIGQQIGASPTAPDQLDWLVGIDVRAQHAEQAGRAYQGIQQRANALLAWLAVSADMRACSSSTVRSTTISSK